MNRNSVVLHIQKIIFIFVKNLTSKNMDYTKPLVLAKSIFQMADCTKKPCGRPSCSTKPSGKH